MVNSNNNGEKNKLKIVLTSFNMVKTKIIFLTRPRDPPSLNNSYSLGSASFVNLPFHFESSTNVRARLNVM